MDTTPPERPQHYKDLWELHNRHPVSNAVWNGLVSIARAEEQTGQGTRGAYGQVPLQDLLVLADKVRAAPDSQARYSLVAEKGPGGKIWFDSLIGFTIPEVTEVLTREIGQRHWEKGVEIGSGTGILTDAMKKHVNTLVTVDKSTLLLKVAKNRGHGENQVVGDATNLPIVGKAVDFAVSSGLTNALTRRELSDFSGELFRVLKPGGVYFDSFVFPPEGEEFPPYVKRSMTNAKGILADLIVDTVSGSATMDKKDRVGSWSEFKDVVARNRFSVNYAMYNDLGVGVVKFEKV
jgi:ubiquinone/menaquinone biosynthesis C-methylase UbiE